MFVSCKVLGLWLACGQCPLTHSLPSGRFCVQITLGSDQVRQVRKDCASVVLCCAERATWRAGEGVQIFGGNGYTLDYRLGRLGREAKLYEIGAGTSEIRWQLLLNMELLALI